MGRRNDIDWGPIRRDYEADILTGQELAEKHGVDRASILRKAKKEGWQKDLSDRVQEATRAKLVTATAKEAGKQQSNTGDPKATGNPGPSNPARATATPTPKDPEQAEQDAVEVAASANVQLILGHRRQIARVRAVTERLLDEAEAQFEDAKAVGILNAGEVLVDGKPLTAAQKSSLAAAIARAKDLPTRASTLKTLSEAMRLQVGLERQAFGIDKGDGGSDPDQTDFRQRLLNGRQRALNARSA